MYRRIALAVALLSLASVAGAQSPRTEHTLGLDDPDSRPAASFADVDWLIGSWAGPAFGGTAEEVWNPPSAGSMVGLFKLIQDGEVAFYELLLLVEEQGSLSLKVKHFNADFSAWEDKADYVDFRFVSAERDAVHFSGISFYRIGPDEIHVYLAMRSGGDLREEKLIYRRR